MPRFKITAPDGREVTIEGPQAPSQADAEKIFASLLVKQPTFEQEQKNLRAKTGMRPSPSAPRQPGKGTDPADIALTAGPAIIGTILAGPPGGVIGGMLGNIGAQSRRILMDEQSPEFRQGEILASGLASAVPVGPMASSGARAVLAEGAKQAGVGGAAKTIETVIDEGRLPTAKEYLLAAGIPAVGGSIAGELASKGADTLSKTERATLEAGKREGYVVTPSSVSDSGINRRLESIAGKAAVGQGAALKNQEVTNQLAKQALGLPENAELTMATLRNLRDQAAIPYQKIEQLSQQAKTDLDAITKSLESQANGDPHQFAILMADPQVQAKIKPLLAQSSADINSLREARFEARKQFDAYRQSGSPDALERARASDELAEMLENRIEEAAKSVGDPDLLDHLREARTRIAKSYDVERALNLGTGEVSAPIIGRQLDRGRPLSDELETIGKFAEAYPSVMREGSKIPTPGVSKIEAGTAALLGALGVGATQSPSGALIGALPLLSGPTRALVLSRPYQALMTAEPFAMPKTAEATRLLSQSTGQELAR